MTSAARTKLAVGIAAVQRHLGPRTRSAVPRLPCLSGAASVADSKASFLDALALSPFLARRPQRPLERLNPRTASRQRHSKNQSPHDRNAATFLRAAPLSALLGDSC